MATKAQLEGNQRYLEKMDDVKIRIPKGMREQLKLYATDHGESLQGYIIRLIEEDSGIKLR